MESDNLHPIDEILIPTEPDDRNGEQDVHPKKRCKYRCPLCPVETTTLSRHLRLVHSIKDPKPKAKTRLLRKVKCTFCNKEVVQLSSHIRGFHKIDITSKLYKHLVRLARYGFMSDGTSSETSDDTDVEKSQLEIIFDEFEKFLTGVDGGFKGDESAKNHRRQVKNMIAASGFGILENLTPLMRENGYLLRQWKDPEDGKKPWRVGTVRSYLCSLKQFLEFCKIEGKHVSKDNCDQGLLKISKWLNSLKTEAKKRHFEYRETEQEKLLSQADLRKYYNSDSQKSLLRLLDIIQETKSIETISQNQLTKLRSGIIFQLLLENGQRSGAVIKSTICEFHQAQKVGEDMVMRVANHKTTAHYGPCNIVMAPNLFKQMTTWVNIIRPQLANRAGDNRDEADNTRIFLNNQGRSLTHSGHSKHIVHYVEQALDVGSMTATRIRKSIVVMLNQNATPAEEMQHVAHHFTHSSDTQKRHYNIKDEVQQAVKSSSIIRNLSKDIPSNEQALPTAFSNQTNTWTESVAPDWTTSSKESLTLSKTCQDMITEAVSSIMSPTEDHNYISPPNQIAHSPKIESAIGETFSAENIFQEADLLCAAYVETNNVPFAQEEITCDTDDDDAAFLKYSEPNMAEIGQPTDKLTPANDVLSLSTAIEKPSPPPRDVFTSGIRRPWDKNEASQLCDLLKSYLTECMKTTYLPKLGDVVKILIANNAMGIMRRNGKQRTMEKVRMELKKLKRKAINEATECI